MNHKNSFFEKQPLSIKKQLELLSSRGLIIKNYNAAYHHLQFISYYRFCGYASAFELTSISGKKLYQKDTNFEQVLDYYVFDRKLRLLVIDAIERIEIAIRTVIINELALRYGAHWYMNNTLFLKKFDHSALINTVKKETLYHAQHGSVQHKKRERFIQHYFDKYQEPILPAIWMIAEVLSLGVWSLIFANLVDRGNQKMICQYFGINYKIMTSWLHCITYLRNLCVHHGRLWNRSFTLKPLIANNYRKQLKYNSNFSAQAAILKIFLNIISPGNHCGRQLYQLIKEHQGIDVRKMGFTENWHKDSFWS